MDYNPYENREIKSLSYMDSVVHMIRCIFGTGILAMPFAFKTVGWMTGITAMGIICLLMTYSVHILVRGMNKLCIRFRVPYIPFEMAMLEGILIGPKMFHKIRKLCEYIVLIFMVGSYLGVGTAYVVFLAESINKLLELHFTPMDTRLLIVILIIPLMFIFIIRNLKKLVPFSVTANILYFSAFIAILYYVVQDLPPLENRRTFNDITGLPLFFGTALFASSSLGVFLAIESKMKDAAEYVTPCGVLNVSMIINYLAVTAFALLGYWQYGDDIEGSVTLNIAKDSILSQFVTVAFMIAIYITYNLQCTVIVEMVWFNRIALRYPPESQLRKEILFRFFVVCTTATLGICLPHFELVVSLAGCITMTILNISFPALLDICLRYETGYGPLKFFLFVDIFLFFTGWALLVLGIMGAFMAQT